MTETISERLRQYAFDIKLHAPHDAKTLIEAADEIDRLTRERDEARKAAEQAIWHLGTDEDRYRIFSGKEGWKTSKEECADLLREIIGA